MTTIVMNTMNAAVTEHEHDLALQSISGDTAGSASGLVTLGGDTDDGEAIAATWLGPLRGGASLKKTRFGPIIFGMQGAGEGEAIVAVRERSDDDNTEWSYRFPLRGAGVSRAVPGLGLRANYYAFGFRNVEGGGFRIDTVQPEPIQSTTRKVT